MAATKLQLDISFDVLSSYPVDTILTILDLQLYQKSCCVSTLWMER